MSERKPKVQPVEDAPQPMSDARLEELRSRAESWRLHYGEGEGLLAGGAECIAEIDRLRAELDTIKKLTITVRDGKCPNCGFAAEDCATWKDTATEMARLRAEVAAKDAEIARWSKSASLHAEMNAQYGKWFDLIIDAIGCDPDSDPYFGDVASAIVEWANTGVRPKFVTVSTNIPKRKRKATP